MLQEEGEKIEINELGREEMEKSRELEKEKEEKEEEKVQI